MKSTAIILIFFAFLLLAGCILQKGSTNNNEIFSQNLKTKLVSSNLFDNARSRSVPIALYTPVTEKEIKNQKLVIFSHGYGQNKKGNNLAYSYLTKTLAKKGYFVASIQHELPTDSLLPVTGIPQMVRRTNWERGVGNILFVINELKELKPFLDYKKVILIGHSNGGDMSMLFAENYPNLVDKVISLDSRRMAFPRFKQPRIYSLRSIDQVADPGVLPSLEEQEKNKMKILKLKKTNHNDMDDSGNLEQHQEIMQYIMGFLKN